MRDALRLFLLGAVLGLAGCSREARLLAADQPQTPPTGATDPRAQRYEANAYQLAQGGRYFTWYGCQACHGLDAKGARDLADPRWLHGSTIDRVYAAIADGHGQAAYRARIPSEQIWQLAAYVRSLPKTDRALVRRQALDQQAEPQGTRWTGPLR